MRYLFPFLLLLSCQGRSSAPVAGFLLSSDTASSPRSDSLIVHAAKVIHVFVALCDNKNQGIVPVPAGIGNGQDPANNLYWGCAGGVKGYFKKQADWKMMASYKDRARPVLERVVFKHRTQHAFLVADAYDGAFIKQCTVDFFAAAAARNNELLVVNGDSIGIGGSAQLICYTGHDGLMDFSLPDYPSSLHSSKRESIILACISQRFFAAGLQKAGASPLLWSTGLMSPESYTLEAAIAGWLLHESPAQIRERAAAAYDRFQHCGLNGARRLLVTGW